MKNYLISFIVGFITIFSLVYGISFGFVNHTPQYDSIRKGKIIYNPIKLMILYTERDGDTMLGRFICL